MAVPEEFHAPTRTTRVKDIVRQAVNDGRPLPLAVLLESMWKWRDEALLKEDPASEDYDPLAARQCRMAAVTVAEKAAPYVHPKLSNIALRPEDEEEAEARRTANRITADQLKGKSVAELGRIYLALAKGDTDEVAELTRCAPEDDACSDNS